MAKPSSVDISKMTHRGAMYLCPHRHNMNFVPCRCKSRLCPTCVKYSQERSASMSFKLVHCIHYHCVFTIDEELQHFFLEYRSLLDCFLFLGYDSLCCSHCKKKIVLVEIHYSHKQVSLQELYKRAIVKAKCQSA